MLAGLGGHAVGMSTVLECIAARWVGLEVCGVSLVTNAGAGYSGAPLTHEEVMAAGSGGGPAPGPGASADSSPTSATADRRPRGRLLDREPAVDRVAFYATGSSRPARRRRLLRPGAQDLVLVRPDRAVAVAVVELVAVAQRHALGGEERPEERRDAEDLVADQLEQAADLPLGHRAQPQPRHVDERPQVRGHDQVGPGRIGEDEPGVLAGNPRPGASRRTGPAPRRPAPRTARGVPRRPRRWNGGAWSRRP